jgi:hypothetical protein
MTQRMQRVHWYAFAFVLFSLFTLTPLVGAQLPSGTGDARVGLASGLPPSLLNNGAYGELLAIYTPRNPDEIQRLLGLARSDKESAEKDIAESRRLATAADGRVRIMNEEVKTTETRLSVAKKEKSAADRKTLDAELKRQKAELRYIERVRDGTQSDAVLLESQSNAATARVKALELETDVAKKYDGLVAVRTDGSSDIASYRDVLKRMLTAREEAANHEVDAASKEKTVATRRLKQLDSLSKLSN